jgi:hypothetical protein
MAVESRVALRPEPVAEARQDARRPVARRRQRALEVDRGQDHQKHEGDERDEDRRDRQHLRSLIAALEPDERAHERPDDQNSPGGADRR